MRVFIEEQKFTQPLVIVGLSLVFIVVGFPIVQNWEHILQSSIGENVEALSSLIIIILVAILFVKLKLLTRIDDKGISYKLSPIHLSYKLITWNDLSKCYVRNYNAIFEYGGWGMKFSFRKKAGRSFTVKGNIGLQLELTNGKKILLGTQKKEELQRILDNYKHKIKFAKS